MGLNVMCTGGTGQKVLVDNTLGSASEYDIMSSFEEEFFNSEIDVAMLNNKAYIFGNHNTYAFDGHGFTVLDVEVPRANHRSCLTFYDGKILAAGPRIRVFDGETVSDFAYQPPYTINGIACLDGDLYAFRKYINGSTGIYYTEISKLINGQWVDLYPDIPGSIYSEGESILTTFNGKIFIIGSEYSNNDYGWAKSIYTFDGTNLERYNNDSFVARGRVSVYDGKMHIMNPYNPYASGSNELIINEDNTRSSNSYTVNNNPAFAVYLMRNYATRVKVSGEEYFLLLYGGIVAKKTANNNIEIVSLIAT